jgi:hypothetical protein
MAPIVHGDLDCDLGLWELSTNLQEFIIDGNPESDRLASDRWRIRRKIIKLLPEMKAKMEDLKPTLTGSDWDVETTVNDDGDEEADHNTGTLPKEPEDKELPAQQASGGAHIARLLKFPARCWQCNKRGHRKAECWVLHPELKPDMK